MNYQDEFAPVWYLTRVGISRAHQGLLPGTYVPGLQPYGSYSTATQGFALGCYVPGLQPYGSYSTATQGFALGCNMPGFQP